MEKFLVEEKIMKKIEQLLRILEKYKMVNFKRIDKARFEKIRAEEIWNYNRLNDEAINKAINYIAISTGDSINNLKKLFKKAIESKSYASLLVIAKNLEDKGMLKDKDLESIPRVSKEFGKKMNKINLDLIADDKTLEKEGFFKQYPHLKK